MLKQQQIRTIRQQFSDNKATNFPTDDKDPLVANDKEQRLLKARLEHLACWVLKGDPMYGLAAKDVTSELRNSLWKVVQETEQPPVTYYDYGWRRRLANMKRVFSVNQKVECFNKSYGQWCPASIKRIDQRSEFSDRPIHIEWEDKSIPSWHTKIMALEYVRKLKSGR